MSELEAEAFRVPSPTSRSPSQLSVDFSEGDEGEAGGPGSVEGRGGAWDADTMSLAGFSRISVRSRRSNASVPWVRPKGSPVPAHRARSGSELWEREWSTAGRGRACVA